MLTPQMKLPQVFITIITVTRNVQYRRDNAHVYYR